MTMIALATVALTAVNSFKKHQLSMAAANETDKQTSENIIAGKITKKLKTKEFKMGIADVRKKGAYKKTSMLFKGEKKKSQNLVKMSTRGAKLNKWTPLDLRVEDEMIKQYSMHMSEHETFMNLHNMNNPFHDWSNVHDWEQKIIARRGKKKADLQRQGADVSAFGDITSGLTTAATYQAKSVKGTGRDFWSLGD